MAKKKKQTKKVAPQPTPRKKQVNGAGSMSKGPRRIVLAVILGGLVAIFVSSFIYRMNHTLQRKVVSSQEHDHGEDGAQSGMPPGMGEGMPPAGQSGGMMGQNGQGMDDIRGLMQSMRENPNDPEVLIALSKRFMNMQDPASAANFLQRALVADPGNIEAMSLLGMVRFQSGEHEEAADLLNRLIKLDSDNATHFYNLGMVEKHFLDQPEAGQQHLETALSLAEAHSDIAHRIQAELEAPSQDPSNADDKNGETSENQGQSPAANATGS